MNKEVESKASRHHDLIQEKQMKEQIKQRGESKLEIKKKQIEKDQKKKEMLKLYEEQSKSPTDLDNNVSNLKKKMKKKSKLK